MNKKILKGGFTKGAIFDYKCPHCYNGILRLSGEFYSAETEASSSYHGEEWWEPEYITLVFSCTLKCTTCFELVFVVGNGVVEEEHEVDHAGEWAREYVEYFSPTFFHPSLQLIDYPEKTPQEVISPLSVASSLYFTSPASCCNNIRIAAEIVLSTVEGEQKENDEAKLSFGSRINRLPEDQASIKKLFSALRWLGNHGSHPGSEIDFDNALHALEIMEFLLEEVFGDRKQELEALAAAINDRKGPIDRLHKLGMQGQ